MGREGNECQSWEEIAKEWRSLRREKALRVARPMDDSRLAHDDDYLLGEGNMDLLYLPYSADKAPSP